MEAPTLGRTETEVYGLALTLPWNYAQTVAAVVRALQAQGFGGLTEIDGQTTFKKKLDLAFPPDVILGSCNPSLAYQALQAEPDLGLLLPCKG